MNLIPMSSVGFSKGGVTYRGQYSTPTKGVLYVAGQDASPPRPVEYGRARYHEYMRTNKVGEQEAAAALDAVSRKVAEEIMPKLERLRAAKGSVRELREEVANLDESVDELAEEVAEVKRAVKVARSRRAGRGRLL